MLDHELRALLSVELSPDFEARVRTTIAAEPARSSWLRWWLPMLAATASLAVAIVWGIGPTVTSLCSTNPTRSQRIVYRLRRPQGGRRISRRA